MLISSKACSLHFPMTLCCNHSTLFSHQCFVFFKHMYLFIVFDYCHLQLLFPAHHPHLWFGFWNSFAVFLFFPISYGTVVRSTDWRWTDLFLVDYIFVWLRTILVCRWNFQYVNIIYMYIQMHTQTQFLVVESLRVVNLNFSTMMWKLVWAKSELTKDCFMSDFVLTVTC